ncbi:MAG: glycosyltransferase [Candidatus Uhrbacteria bacterium]
MSTPRISVIIPVFNDNGALADCLISLKKQTFQDFEVITVDDSSKTPVVEATIRFDQNKGAPAARNAGFAISKGEYVIFLDHDAVLVPDALELMVKTLETHPEVDFAYPSHYFGRTLFSAKPFDEVALREAPYIHTSALIRREAFPGFDESLKKFQDWDLFLMMSEAGSKGIAIDRVLFTLKTRGTMSTWIPAFMFQLPWKTKSMKRYLDADRIIRQKHGLPEQTVKIAETHWFWLGLILLVEALSIPAAFYPTFSLVCSIIGGLVMLVLSFLHPDIALGAVVTEFMIGSLGHQFRSFRMVLVGAFVLGWLGNALKSSKFQASSFKLQAPYYFLAASVCIGILIGYWKGSPYLLVDANSWVAFVLIFPVIHLAKQNGKNLRRILIPVVEIALCWMSVKSLGLFYLFSHDVGSWVEQVYLWVRRSGVGELTRITQATSATRVFIQSQIYAVLAVVGLIGVGLRSRKQQVLYVLSVATILVSFSRSFWIGCFFAFVFVILRRKSWMLLPRATLGAGLGLLIPILIFLFPFPASYGNLMDVFFARANTGESAAMSRWALLPILNAKIAEAPIFGSGFGATVTYESKDPRVVASTGGTYTTYAFEWGWHDIAVKLGLVGACIYAWLLVSLFRRLGKAGSIGWQAALIALAITHVFTPYLGHPLGILFIILAEASLVA